MLPKRKRLPHTPPSWVPDASLYFITICCRHRNQNTLAHPDIAKSLFDSIAYRESLIQWNVHLTLLMPDHLHAFIAFAPHQAMTKTIADWKKYTARTFKVEWQDGFFDHRLRNKSERDEKWNYILQNPVRANLCEQPTDWPYTRTSTW